MHRYQADIDYFKQKETEILAVSVDAQPTQKRYAQDLGATFHFLADWPEKKVSRLYGVLSERGFANRTTFVIDKQGVIRHIASGREAIDISGAKSACARLQ